MALSIPSMVAFQLSGAGSKAGESSVPHLLICAALAGRGLTNCLTGIALCPTLCDLRRIGFWPARRAIRSLARTPAHSIPFMRQLLRPTEAVDMKNVARLIDDLNAERFAVRDSATKELECIGEQAIPAIRNALRGTPSAELQNRAEDLVNKILAPLPTVSERQQSRAIEALEQIGTVEAKQHLQSLAEGDPESSLTKRAKATLERMKRRQECSH